MNQTPASEPTPDAADSGEGDCTDGPDRSISIMLDVDEPEPPDTAWLADRLDDAAAELSVRVAHLGVIVTGDACMADLHHRFMDQPTTTDVLTFDLRDEPDEPIEGEVYLCLDEARRRAAAMDHDVDHELLLYALHGLLHLIGHDDRDPQGHARMHAEEDRVLEAIGVGKVYGS